MKRSDALMCLEDSDNSTCIRSDVKATRLDALQFSRRIQISFIGTDPKRQLATVRMLGQHRPDTTLIWKRVKRVMERRLHSSLSGRYLPPFRRRLEKSESDSI
jgi:hypothetical protein